MFCMHHKLYINIVHTRVIHTGHFHKRSEVMNTVTAFSGLYDIWYPYISCQLLDMPGCCQILSTSFISCGLRCIRPHLKYACTIWHPYFTNEITQLQNVSTFAFNDYTVCCTSWLMDYESILTYLDMPSLQWRKLQLKVKWCTILCMATVSSLKV